MNELVNVHETLSSLTGADFVDCLYQLQNHIIANADPSALIDPPIKHYFAPNIYVREMYAPAGSVIIGEMHKTEHICTVISGRATIYSEHGKVEIKGGQTFVSPMGAKRLFVIEEDLVFQTVHHTKLTDLDEIRKELLVPDEEFQKFRLANSLEVNL
ncbi:Uncharacterised protein [Acinetobacter baumannii]|uniref:Cupin n=1 Tax=Acinetobacter baumannii TaxID=470 RepID=A0A9P2L9D1_ACIBA|nr:MULTISPECIES: hypothetical protein [Acinetobacter calcoaceticus/baumannii complex]EKT9124108.1 hypothetical protein [Acinetobacter baumannii]EKT9273338.1 hypothetical protein [Acinetobacter baumannii]EKT9294560.1 hypothetical protein [Acinetobacter baumannii]EKT9315342.1 hypothetical protein [Acinetobacter baumannii]EKU0110631.1 hypothetical protein [Acinetobacter baumannii]